EPLASTVERLDTIAARETERLQRRRALIARSEPHMPRRSPRGPAVTIAHGKGHGRIGGQTPQLVLTYLIAVDAEDGRRVHAEPFTMAIRVQPQVLRTPADVRVALDRNLRQFERSIAELLRHRSRFVRRRILEIHEQSVRRLSEREAAIAHTVQSAARRIAQPRLFGRRPDVTTMPQPAAPTAASTTVRARVDIETQLAAAIFLDRSPSRPAINGEPWP
ncbi:MAG TPA: hypothetical protein VFJ02_11395, partial [Vicinamibacterales bacterium]|nr:hypothetical protein [Vicinamibacterales bacterium]